MNVKNDISYRRMMGGVPLLVVAVFIVLACKPSVKEGEFYERTQLFAEIDCPTPNIDLERENELLGVVLHHTAEPTVEEALHILLSPEKKVETHVVIRVHQGQASVLC